MILGGLGRSRGGAGLDVWLGGVGGVVSRGAADGLGGEGRAGGPLLSSFFTSLVGLLVAGGSRGFKVASSDLALGTGLG